MEPQREGIHGRGCVLALALLRPAPPGLPSFQGFLLDAQPADGPRETFSKDPTGSNQPVWDLSGFVKTAKAQVSSLRPGACRAQRNVVPTTCRGEVRKPRGQLPGCGPTGERVTATVRHVRSRNYVPGAVLGTRAH